MSTLEFPARGSFAQDSADQSPEFSPERSDHDADQRESACKEMVYAIADRLGKHDINAIVFYHNLPEELNAASSLEVLNHLYRHGHFTPGHVKPLITLLKYIKRNDLVLKVQDYQHNFAQRRSSSPVPRSPILVTSKTRSISEPASTMYQSHHPDITSSAHRLFHTGHLPVCIVTQGSQEVYTFPEHRDGKSIPNSPRPRTHSWGAIVTSQANLLQRRKPNGNFLTVPNSGPSSHCGSITSFSSSASSLCTDTQLSFSTPPPQISNPSSPVDSEQQFGASNSRPPSTTSSPQPTHRHGQLTHAATYPKFDDCTRAHTDDIRVHHYHHFPTPPPPERVTVPCDVEDCAIAGQMMAVNNPDTGTGNRDYHDDCTKPLVRKSTLPQPKKEGDQFQSSPNHRQARKLRFSLPWKQPATTKNIVWRIKRSEINEAIYEHREEQVITCPDRLVADIGYGGANPRLLLKLRPHGIEEDYDKNVTLEIDIELPKKCPRLHSAAKIDVTLSSWDCKENKPFSSRQEISASMNMRSVSVKQFISHNALKHSRSDLVEIRAAVCNVHNPQLDFLK